MNDSIRELVERFWQGTGITLQLVETVIEGDDVDVRIETPDSALVIGMHGRSLDSFVHLLSRMIEKSLGKFVHVHLEVNDYMKSKDERLYRFLDSKIEFVMSVGKSIRIPNLTSYDRKKAHGYISEKNISGLATHSEGVGSERALMIEYMGELKPATKPQSSTMSVDDLSEDGVGI